MALATAGDVLEETGADYEDFRFVDSATFDAWINKKITFVDNKIKDMVGTYYTDPKAIPDLSSGEVCWVYYEMLQRKQSILTSSIEGGFALGSLRIDSAAGAAERLKPVADEYFRRARMFIEPYVTLSGGKFLIVEDVEVT